MKNFDNWKTKIYTDYIRMILHVLNMYNHFKLDIIYKKKNKTFSNIIMILTNLPSYIRFKSKLELINTVKKREHFKQ